MILKAVRLYRGHKQAAKEKTGHYPPVTAILKQMLYELLRFKVITDNTGAYVVYEIARRYHLNNHCVVINSVYCPPQYRRTGVITELYDRITRKHRLNIVLFNYKQGYKHIGSVYIRVRGF